MWEQRHSPNHMRNHFEIMLVCWNAVLVSAGLAECEQVLCKCSAQPCVLVTLSPCVSKALLCTCMKPGLGRAAGTCVGSGYSGRAIGIGPIDVFGCN